MAAMDTETRAAFKSRLGHPAARACAQSVGRVLTHGLEAFAVDGYAATRLRLFAASSQEHANAHAANLDASHDLMRERDRLRSCRERSRAWWAERGAPQ